MDFETLARDLRAFAHARATRIDVWIQIVDVSDRFGGTLAERFRAGTWPPPTQPRSRTGEPTQEKQT